MNFAYLLFRQNVQVLNFLAGERLRNGSAPEVAFHSDSSANYIIERVRLSQYCKE